MWMQKIWKKLDDTVQRKFKGDYGEAAYDEALTIVMLYGAHELLLHKAPREHHPHINAAWYGSLFAKHPLHPLRVFVQDKIAQFGSATYDPVRNPLHRQLSKFGDQVHSKISDMVRDRDHDRHASAQDKADWVDQQMDDISDFLDDHVPPRR
jgi:hypothetical protein